MGWLICTGGALSTETSNQRMFCLMAVEWPRLQVLATPRPGWVGG